MPVKQIIHSVFPTQKSRDELSAIGWHTNVAACQPIADRKSRDFRAGKTLWIMDIMPGYHCSTGPPATAVLTAASDSATAVKPLLLPPPPRGNRNSQLCNRGFPAVIDSNTAGKPRINRGSPQPRFLVSLSLSSTVPWPYWSCITAWCMLSGFQEPLNSLFKPEERLFGRDFVL